MFHPFEIGRSYTREEILTFLGSKQRQSGIVYGAQQPQLVAVFTGGRHGPEAGYTDHWNEDGTFSYCGQGTKGDQRVWGANRVLLDSSKTILLFETWKPPKTWKGMNRFVGEFLVGGSQFEDGNGKRLGDKLLIMSLIPIEDQYQGVKRREVAIEETTIDFGELRQLALASSHPFAATKPAITEFRSRSDAVARYSLARSHGKCEMCGNPVPFSTAKGKPFLEVHHTQKLADDGPDDILHVAAVCPNCHREAHFGPDIAMFRNNLEEIVRVKEETYSPSSEPST